MGSRRHLELDQPAVGQRQVDAQEGGTEQPALPPELEQQGLADEDLDQCPMQRPIAQLGRGDGMEQPVLVGGQAGAGQGQKRGARPGSAAKQRRMPSKPQTAAATPLGPKARRKPSRRRRSSSASPEAAWRRAQTTSCSPVVSCPITRPESAVASRPEAAGSQGRRKTIPMSCLPVVEIALTADSGNGPTSFRQSEGFHYEARVIPRRARAQNWPSAVFSPAAPGRGASSPRRICRAATPAP